MKTRIDLLSPVRVGRYTLHNHISAVIAQFRNGAIHALDAGFDGVEIHAANGSLIDQFLRDGTNRHTDIYGGSVANRARFLMEVVEAVADVWGANRVGVRLSPVNPFNSMYDSDPQTTFEYMGEQANRLGLAYLHVVEADEHGEATHPAVNFRRLRDAFGGTFTACTFTTRTATSSNSSP